ncbi:MAG TPA: endolytic transglycosylase MltG [bacterium]|nr:endolytic transglycosylase MltG [bacterium]
MSEQLDPSKFHVFDAKKKKVLVVSLILLLILAIPLASFYYSFAINRPAQNSERTVIEIESGQSLVEISKNLYSKDLINSQGLFLFYVVVNNLDKNIQAGVYSIPSGTSLRDLVLILQKGTKDVTVTFLEGWRVEEFALAASKNLKFVNYDDFVLQATPLEGYLFPDTYHLRYDINTEDLIKLLSKTFDDKTRELFKVRNDLTADLSNEEIVILASLIEREIHVEEDRPLVAGILVKRLQQGIPLGVDATSQYYIPFLRAKCPERSWVKCFTMDEAEKITWWVNDITQEELEYDSPYNTRKNRGLPPTPISSFGISALKAALEPEQTDYFFYITDRTGTTRFAKTLSEHENNILKYLR